MGNVSLSDLQARLVWLAEKRFCLFRKHRLETLQLRIAILKAV